MGVEGLYNQESFSDLTLKLGNGATIKVHKTVICSQNEYFNKLCGPESRFAVRTTKQRVLPETSLTVILLTGARPRYHRAQRG